MRNLLYLLLCLLSFININSQEICNDGIDNDGNFLIDCAEPDCNATPNCDNTIPCTGASTFYQVIGGTEFNIYDPATKTYNPIFNNTQIEVNAIGYNVQDGFIYGIEVFTNNLVRIGANGLFESLGTVDSLPNPMLTPDPTDAYYAGDFDLNGNLYVYNNRTTDIYAVDVSTQTATIAATIAATIDLADIAYVSFCNVLFGIDDNTGNLIRIDFATGVSIDLGATTPPTNCGGSFFGAAFSDVNGDLYFFCNQSGEIFKVNPATMTSELFDTSVSTGLARNDGAACALSSGLELNDCFDQLDFTIEQEECNIFNFTPDIIAAAGTTVVNHFWDFGDGNTTMTPNPSHTYTDNGTYTVTLTVTAIDNETGVCCCESVTQTVIVECGCELITDFNITQLNCNSYLFTANPSAGAGTTIMGYYWDLGDGTSSTVSNPTHSYTNGAYEITLTVAGVSPSSGECCCDVYSESVQVSCNNGNSLCGTIGTISPKIQGSKVQFSIPENSLTINEGWKDPSYSWTFTCNNNPDMVQTSSSLNPTFDFSTLCRRYVVAVNINVINPQGEICKISHSQPFSPVFSTPLLISPNPASKNVEIQVAIPNYEGKMIIEIIAANGSKLKQIDVENNTTNNIDIQNLATGTYIINAIVNNQVSASEKLVVQTQY